MAESPSDSDKNSELGSNPTKGIFVFVLFLLRTIMCKVFVVPMEWRRNKKVIYKKRDLRAHLFLINDLCFKGVLFRVSRKFAASHNFPGRGEIVADRSRGTALTLEENLITFLCEVSEHLLLGDVGMNYLKYDGPSSNMIGHDLDSRGWWT